MNKKVGTIPVPNGTRRDLILEAGAFSQQMALPWQADFRDCAAGDVTDPLVAGRNRRVGWWPTNRPDEVFPDSAPTARTSWARYADKNFPELPKDRDPTAAEQTAYFKAMVDDWWTLGFVIQTTPAGAAQDLYEVEFTDKAAVVAPVIAAIPGPVAGG